MSIEEELLRLAREREVASEAALDGMMLEPPDHLRRQLRAYLSRQVDHRRIRRTDEKVPRLATLEGGLNELACPKLNFTDGRRLEFKIQLEKQQRGWLVRCFQFHVYLPQQRPNVIQIHLNAEASRDPLAVPRCHLHVGGSQAHVPFPITDPRLILHLICEHIQFSDGD